jgi:hypothetical protein
LAYNFQLIRSKYFIYCLYFGNSGIERARHFRAAKQQLYIMFHLPFHLALALTLEGLRTWTIIANVQYNFHKIYDYVNVVIGQTPDVFRLDQFNATTGSQIVKTLNETLKGMKFDDSSSWDSMQNALTKLNLTWSDDVATIGAQPKVDVLKFWYTELSSLVQNEQFISNSLVVPEVQVLAAKGSGVAQMDAYLQVFRMIFIYFFFCTAVVMILLGVFRSMSIGIQDRFDKIMINLRVLLGVGLGMLGLLSLTGERVTSYIDSGVLLPTLLFILIFGKLIDHMTHSESSTNQDT